MDPLTITTSIVSLLASSAKIIAALSSFASNASDVSTLITQLRSEAEALGGIMCQLQSLILRKGTQPRKNRSSMISLEQLVTILTACMCTFSRLEQHLCDNEEALSVWARVKWAWKTPALRKLLEDLQQHKASLNLLLGIMQCYSDSEALQKLKRLSANIQTLMDSHHNLLETISAQPRATTFSQNSLHLGNDHTTASLLEASDPRIAPTPTLPFESILLGTKVYSQEQHRSSTGTTLCDLLSDASVLSAPIWPKDLWNLGRPATRASTETRFNSLPRIEEPDSVANCADNVISISRSCAASTSQSSSSLREIEQQNLQRGSFGAC